MTTALAILAIVGAVLAVLMAANYVGYRLALRDHHREQQERDARRGVSGGYMAEPDQYDVIAEAERILRRTP
jgi:hypothetical protein